MKELTGTLLARLHWIIMLYAAWSVFEIYSGHETQLEEITLQREPLEAEISKAEERLKQIEEFRKNVDQTKTRVTEVFSSIERVQKQLPSEVSDIEILDMITKEGRSLNMPSIEPSPLEEQSFGFYISKPYRIKAKGTFLQFVIFMERINSAERLFNVREFKMVSPPDSQRSRFQVVDFEAVIDTYKYNTLHSESSGLAEIESQFGSTAEPRPRRKKRKGSEDE